jgi:aminopeptidase N
MMSSVRNLIILTVLIHAIWGSPLQPLATVVEDLRYRLTDDVLPSQYSIWITPYFVTEGSKEAFTFDGVVEITLKATVSNASEIVLHVNSLDIDEYSFDGGAAFKYNESQYNLTYDKWTIPYPTNLNGGFVPSNVDTVLKVVYRGYMKDDMYGFYRSYYTENGKQVWMGTTQFQPVHARRAFPCFDEPGFKAYFNIIIRRPKDVAGSLANTGLAMSTNLTDRYEDVFKRTPLVG